MKMNMLHEAARELASRAERNLHHADQLQYSTSVSATDKAEMQARLAAMEYGINQIRSILES